MSLRLLLCIATLLMGISVTAQDRLAYVRADLGYMFWQETDASVSGLGTAALDADEVTSIRVGVGVHLRKGYRIDVTWQQIAEIDLSGTIQAVPFSGAVSTNLLMLNGSVDLGQLFGIERINPYVGVGVGLATHDVDDFGTSTGTVTVEGDSSSVFAWQWTIGLQWQIRDNVQLDIAYTQIDAGIAETSDAVRLQFFTTTLPAPAEFDMQFEGLMVGVSWGF